MIRRYSKKPILAKMRAGRKCLVIRQVPQEAQLNNCIATFSFNVESASTLRKKFSFLVCGSLGQFVWQLSLLRSNLRLR